MSITLHRAPTDAVRATIQATVAAWTANDADAFADLYTEDATVVLATGALLRGRDEIRGYMSAGFSGPLAGSRGHDEQLLIRVLGSSAPGEGSVAPGGAAVVVSESGYLLPGEQSVPADRVRRATWLLSRTGETWLVEAYHNCGR